MVMIGRRKSKPARPRYVAKMSTSDLIEWFDVDLMGLGAAFDQFRLHGGPPGEVTLRLEQLHNIWNEIAARQEHK